MKSKRRLIEFTLLVLVLVFLSGCSGTSNDREAEIQFDGKTAQYEGPEVIPPGEFKITLENASDYDLDILVVKIAAGNTFQDLLDYLGTPGSKVPPPNWVENTTSLGVPGEPDATSFALDNGSYAIILCTCSEILDYQVWPVTSLVVESD